jgi:peptide deformylase
MGLGGVLQMYHGMNIVSPGHAALWTVAEPVTDIAAQVVPHLDPMRRLIRRLNGAGLAAPQVGISLRFFFFNGCVAINPRVLSESEQTETRYEGCLTWRNRFVPKSRPVSAVVGYTREDGTLAMEELIGIEARCFLHELDHLNGVCLFPQPVPAPQEALPR